MSQVFHIAKNKKHLELRSKMLQAVRHFFVSRDFVEIEAPLFVRLAGQEPYLSPVSLSIKDENNNAYTGYLSTSPEFTMKKCLAAGFENIFYLGKSFRDNESLTGLHHPEFTMLEWYRNNCEYNAIMDDTEKLVKTLGSLDGVNPDSALYLIKKWERVHMRDLWKQVIDIDLDQYLTTDAMYDLCLEHGHAVAENDSYGTYFHTIFLNEIEPTLGMESPVIVHHFPAQMAALANVDGADSKYAKRFEVYMRGIEIANAFDELCDAAEQEERFIDDQRKRASLGKEPIDIDTAFLDALDNIDRAAGIALGFDRLVMLSTGCQNIEDVLVLPMKKQFNT